MRVATRWEATAGGSLSQDQDVGSQPTPLGGEDLPRPTEAGGHLVADEQHTMAAARLSYPSIPDAPWTRGSITKAVTSAACRSTAATTRGAQSGVA